MNEEDYQTSIFVPEHSLVDECFWHEYDEGIMVICEDRAMFFQSQENQLRLRKNPLFTSYFDDVE